MGPIAPWRIVFWDAGELQADAASVNALARLQLAAKRRGYRVLFRHVSRELRALVAFMGLGDVLPTDDFSRRTESNSVQPSNGEV
jgi:ABC-type transporter Mla MlaB component